MVPEATINAPLYCCHRLPILRLIDAGSLEPSLGLPPLDTEPWEDGVGGSIGENSIGGEALWG